MQVKNKLYYHIHSGGVRRHSRYWKVGEKIKFSSTKYNQFSGMKIADILRLSGEFRKGQHYIKNAYAKIGEAAYTLKRIDFNHPDYKIGILKETVGKLI